MKLLFWILQYCFVTLPVYNREKLFAMYPERIPAEILEHFNSLVEKRLTGLPVSYIRNSKEFFGRDFYVDSSVLVPRPDTETLVETAMEITDRLAGRSSRTLQVLDLCTGSGCIAVTLKAERPGLNITASDISAEALKTAAINAERHGTAITFNESGLFDKIREKFDIIVTNPPYVTAGETAEMKASGWPEPGLALDGGEDGLDLIRRIIKSSLDYLNNNSYLLIEAGAQQSDEIKQLMRLSGFEDIFSIKDLAGRDRVTGGRINGPRD